MIDILAFVQEKHDLVQTLILLSLLAIAAISYMLIRFLVSSTLRHITGWKAQVDTLLANSPGYQQSTTEHLTSILACQQSQSTTLDAISSLLADQKAHNARIEGEIKVLHIKNENTALAVCEVKKSAEQNTRVIADIHNRTTVLENTIRATWKA